MDLYSLLALVVGLVVGAVACWLVMRRRPADDGVSARLRAETDHLRSEGDRLRQESSSLRAENDGLRRDGDGLRREAAGMTSYGHMTPSAG